MKIPLTRKCLNILLINLFLITVLYACSININGTYGIINIPEYVFTTTICYFAICLAILSAITDAALKITNHTGRYIFRGIVLAILPLVNYVHNDYQMSFFANFALSITTFYLFFDYLYNTEKGNDIEYIGNTAIHDKVLRLLFRGKHGSLQVLIFKLLLFVGSYILTIKL
jgi:hypothetical protein